MLLPHPVMDPMVGISFPQELFVSSAGPSLHPMYMFHSLCHHYLPQPVCLSLTSSVYKHTHSLPQWNFVHLHKTFILGSSSRVGKNSFSFETRCKLIGCLSVASFYFILKRKHKYRLPYFYYNGSRKKLQYVCMCIYND